MTLTEIISASFLVLFAEIHASLRDRAKSHGALDDSLEAVHGRHEVRNCVVVVLRVDSTGVGCHVLSALEHSFLRVVDGVRKWWVERPERTKRLLVGTEGTPSRVHWAASVHVLHERIVGNPDIGACCGGGATITSAPFLVGEIILALPGPKFDDVRRGQFRELCPSSLHTPHLYWCGRLTLFAIVGWLSMVSPPPAPAGNAPFRPTLPAPPSVANLCSNYSASVAARPSHQPQPPLPSSFADAFLPFSLLAADLTISTPFQRSVDAPRSLRSPDPYHHSSSSSS
eukprot:CAMPEP_0198723886 /NCGR_PEP_ID=MMETSP1475-20131203/1399_1 /TAXON_ID= ORGANISM="Unidentified sp., Strain CCMP1999" /NCGR_SAMPLE_ID=MMETSP1475 /ASSEMBLY_ACC=CAM_ASM_001111 /LENGTH=284 /DNA_ID=CAMNT_0044485207 /DNA_START=1309 /DNA_END=2161 /DNA_ORIENTATION=+